MTLLKVYIKMMSARRPTPKKTKSMCKNINAQHKKNVTDNEVVFAKHSHIDNQKSSEENKMS